MDSRKKKSKHYVESWSDHHRHEKKKSKFHSVSMILAVGSNLTLDKNGTLKFSNGMVEGKGISINSNGDVITFEEEGSYRFEISGEGIIHSDTDAKLIYESDDFPSEIEMFSETTIPREGNKLILRGIPTILPMKSEQKVVVKIIPVQQTDVVIFEGTRLLIHRVA